MRICASLHSKAGGADRGQAPREREQLRSRRIDHKFLTGKYTGHPDFYGHHGLVFFLTFNVIGLFFQNLLEMGIDALTGIVDKPP